MYHSPEEKQRMTVSVKFAQLSTAMLDHPFYSMNG